ncbi:polysaccharide deacetylase family protein [Planomonospora corallina]|uniref:Polysaccharide deacetylase family protein n=1 Tax=Planomonospora corallina TaxID=1806052 RepID=A0ABV8I832_9ACTN
MPRPTAVLAVAALMAACGAAQAGSAGSAAADAPTASAARSPLPDTVPPAPPAAPSAAPTAAAGPALSVSAADESPDCRRVKCVALTFDDGPGRHTGTLLRHLAKHDARATFFVVGRNAAADPGAVRRTAEAGHEIGNHSWSHRDLTRLSDSGIRADLARADRAIEKATGAAPELFRPPYGALDAGVRKQAGRPVVLWSVDTLDWRYRDSATVARRAVKGAKPGAVILFHDIHPTTVKAIPEVLKSLSKRGYHFVTVSGLFRGKPPKLVHSGAPRAAGSR